MSDTRDEAEQEMVSAGIASGMEDTLGSALSASFSMPPPQPRKKDSQSMMAAVAQAEKDTPAAQNEPSEPVPGMDEWKATYEGYLSAWQAESHEAREKAKATREAIEKEHADEAKAAADKVKADKREAEQKKKAKADQEKLQAELEGRKVGSTSKNTAAENEERERKVKEAWEMVKGADDGEETKEVVTDARGVTPRDLAAGQAVAEGQKRPKVAQTMYDPTTSTEPLPPSMQDSSSPSPTLPTDSVMQSRHSTTSQAWEEINRSSSSGSGEDLVEVSKPSSPQQSGSGTNQQPPSHPPSLTLSVFSSPSTLSVSRVVAVLGINLVLPFINGVMLGFGEIFARQVVSAGRAWYWEGSNFIHKLVGRDTRDRSSGVSGVGLSGSRGFP